jgi:hypothetical protein
MQRSAHPVQTPRFYSTAEVALILNTDEWRVRNFGAPAYGLEAQIKAPGSGHRKRYFFEVVLKLAVADELYSAQMSPAGIKAALALIDKQRLIAKWIASYSESVSEMVLALDARTMEWDAKETTRMERVWKVFNAEHASTSMQNFLGSGSVAVALDLVELWEGVVKRITELEGEGRI